MVSSAQTATTTSTAAAAGSNPRPNKRIEHVTVIDAPVDDVWRALVDLGDWSWNRWTRLDVPEGEIPAAGTKGKLRACYEGDGKDWQTFDFEIADVDNDRRVLAWGGVMMGGYLFRGCHAMRLESIVDGEDDNNNSAKQKQTRLIHTEDFSGLLPRLKLGLPYSTLDRNYRLMNEALKAHVEKQ